METSKNTVVLQDVEGKALGNVDVLIRDATSGSDCRCGKFGGVNKRVRTDKAGRFELKGLAPGDYWITYMNQQHGESFYIRFEHARSLPGPLELQIDHLGEQCYLVDVERNSTKPLAGPSKPRTN
jgi:hypothetical protein